MCGIFGFLSGARPERVEGGEARLFDALAELERFAPQAASEVEDLGEDERRRWLERLDAAQAAASLWVQEEPFLRAAGDPALVKRLRAATELTAAWSRRLEGFSSTARLRRQRDWELLNRLAVGGKDIAWQIEEDVLGRLAAVPALLGSGAPCPSALRHAWQLRLVLSSLDRLEVRGRDSAGLAVYLRFPAAAALEAFLDGAGSPEGAAGRRSFRRELAERSSRADLGHGAIVRPASHDATLLLVFKVAREIGKMGDNVAFLRAAIARDAFFQAALRAPGVDLQCLAHTRWASNGVISVPNCHPVDSAVRRPGKAGVSGVSGAGEVVAVLNGDVDNYRELVARYVHSEGLALEESITTDAKIIPVVVAHHYRRWRDLAQAFRAALEEFEGSMAIGVMAADRPGELLFGQKGSGQGLFLGVTERAVAVASEMYGVVEFTPRYVKAEGESAPGGEVLHLVADGERVRIERASGSGASRFEPLSAGRMRTAEITTRDINRGEHPHFFLKEVRESVESVRRTLRGKFEVVGDGVRFLLGPEVLPPKLIDGLRSGRIRQVLVAGQGTAAVAGEGIAHLLRVALRRAAHPLEVSALKATELSGSNLRPDMSDCLLVVVSQSGTTADTNRTVDLARQRGAWVISIVNRRNSDLVYKSHGVLYTSDGRDIEMSVASTKAFYSQNVAGEVLALGLAAELGTLDPPEILREVAKLEELPHALARTLSLVEEIEDLASRFALERRHWAIAGSGAAKIAANEIRIKLSELCYKSIAVDFLEDKKHIDLSSEPLILVCASGIPPETVSDAVKEVAIFKAHASLPIVIADEGEERFDPYAAGIIKVPRTDGPLDYLLATMVGHLFGYHAAAASDRLAERLRRLRGELLEDSAPGPGGGGAEDDRGRRSLTDRIHRLAPETTEELVAIEDLLLSGAIDGALNASTAARLAAVLAFLLGRIPVAAFTRRHSEPLAAAVEALSEAVNELTRPIDAIKHQAKTVTVGISRSEASSREGPLWAPFHGFSLPVSDLDEPHRRFLAAFEPLVDQVHGATLYEVASLDPLGRPKEGSTIRVLEKKGSAARMLSRCEDARPLAGTKWAVVKRRELYLGYGQTDGQRILILPVVGERSSGRLLLYHLELVPGGARDLRLAALESLEERCERLRVAVTEGNVAWEPKLIDLVDNETLFFEHVDTLAERILETHAHARQA